jgi:hypothetical protein
MTHYDDQLRQAIGAVEIISPTVYRWFGHRARDVPRGLRTRLGPTTARGYLVASLQLHLYRHFYCQGAAVPTSAVEDAQSSRNEVDLFLERLSAANAGQGHWEDGWTVLAVDSDGVLAHNGRLAVRVPTALCRVDDRAELGAGRTVAVRQVKEHRRLSPGFYMALSDTPFERDRPRQRVRLYLNVAPGGAVHHVERATRALNALGTPFKLKVVSDPLQYHRCDTSVLYVDRRDHRRALAVLDSIRCELDEQVRPGTPSLSMPIAPGMAAAEDWNQDESFGQHRCRLVAEALVAAHDDGVLDAEERLQRVRERFAHDGVDPDRPYLGPRPKVDYLWEAVCQAGQCAS